MSNAVQALQGVVPGLNIDTGNYGGDLNASKSVNIRGTGTLDSSQSKGDPLILIDGMEGDLNTINPQDIENNSVLKDAAASSIYGSRAPFGVILVTTKSGKAGRMQVNYNTNLRWNTPINLPDMMNSHQYVTFYDQAEHNNSGKHLYDDVECQKVWDYMTGASDVYVEANKDGKWNYDHTYANVDGKRYARVSNDLPVLDLTTSTDQFELGSEYGRWRNAGFFGRINYDYDGKYLVEGNLRYDGSSRFRRDSRWVWSPSFSLGWNVAREKFWKPIEQYVNTLKVRVSYGVLANQNTTSWYPTYQTINIGTGKWLQDGIKPITSEIPSLISTSLTWEKIKNTNLGLDFGAFNNRLTGSFDYFWRKSQGLVGPGVELPSTLGIKVPSTNNTDLTTSGWELSLQWRDHIGDFRYDRLQG